MREAGFMASRDLHDRLQLTSQFKEIHRKLSSPVFTHCRAPCSERMNPPVDDSECCNYRAHGIDGTDKASRRRKTLVSRTKLAPSKWDDAQKWLVGFPAKNKPRNSNADDKRLLDPKTYKFDDGVEETKKIDFCSEESLRRIKKAVSLRDVGTEMTPVASKEPSRTATPLRASSPNSSPGKCEEVIFSHVGGNVRSAEGSKDLIGCERLDDCGFEKIRDNTSLESRAVAWDEAERAKYTASYKREAVKIEAWQNHETRKAEMEMRRMEVKAERMKSRAREKLTNMTTTARRVAEEKRGNAEAKLNERAARTSERADYIRRTGHLPFSFLSFKLPSLCSSCSIN